MANENLEDILGLQGNALQELSGNLDNLLSGEMASDLKRKGGIAGTRALEGFFGAPGQVANLAADVGNLADVGIDKLLGAIPGIGSSLQGLKRFLSDGAPGQALQKTPVTPKGIREYVTKPLLAESVKPKTDADKAIAGFAQDLGSFMGMGTPAKTAAGIASFGNTAKAASKMLGFEKPTQEAVKMGTMLLYNMKGGAKKVKEHVNNMYEALWKKTPAKKMVSIDPLKDSIKKVESIVERDFTKNLPAKTFLNNKLKEIKSLSKDGKVKLGDLIQMDRDLNSIIYNREYKGIKNLIKDVQHDIKKSIGQFASENPDWAKMKESADTMYKAMKSRSVIHDNIINMKDRRHFSFKNPLTWALLGHHSGYANPIMKSGAGLYGLGFLEKGLKQVIRDPRVAKIYAGLVPGALGKSTAGIANSIARLDRAVSKASKPFKTPEGLVKLESNTRSAKTKTPTSNNKFKTPKGLIKID